MAEESDKYRSFRLACDRCRSHKLKCPQNPSSVTGDCQRCTRAKAQCNFSPRARAVRNTQNGSSMQGKAIQKPGKRGGSQSPSAPASPPTGPENLQQQQPGQQNGSGSSRWDPSWGPLGSLDVLSATPQATFHAGSDVSPSDFSAAISMDSAFMDCSPFAEPCSGSTMHHAAFDFQFDMDHFGSLPDRTSSMGPSLTGQSGKGDEDIPMSSVDSSGLQDEGCTKKLSSLAVKFQRHLMLISQHSGHGERNPSGDEAQHWLSTYPIGEILCLSEEFSSTLEPELYPHGRGAPGSIDESNNCSRRPRCTQPPRVGHPDGHDANLSASATLGSDVAHACHYHPNTPDSMAALGGAPASAASTPTSTSPMRVAASSSSASGVDTPMALLILNCYVSMIRIYSALFAHLHGHLRSVAPARRRRNVDPRTDPGLKFGELPPTDDDVSLRTYAAVRLLLDALQHSEELLDLPNDLRYVRVVRGLDETTAASSASDSEAESMDSSVCLSSGLPGPSSGQIIGSELARAVFRQEAQMGTEHGGGGLVLLRKNIEKVKRSLRQRMAL